MSAALLMLAMAGLRFQLPSGGTDEASSGTAAITVTLNSNGTVTVNGVNAGTIASFAWVVPTSLAPGPYHIRMDASSGSFTSGTTGADLALSSNRSWVLSRASVGESQVNFTLTLKDASGGNVLATQAGSCVARCLT